MVKFISSGYLVVGEARYINNTRYCGIDTHVFPLDEISYSQNYMSAELDPNDTCFLDYPDALDYYTNCKKNGMNARILYCEATFKGPQIPLFDTEHYNVLFIGYDYTYPNGDYFSTIANEVLYQSNLHTTQWRSHLNTFGLFNSIKIVARYINDRNYHKIKNADNCFEAGSFCVVRVYEIRGHGTGKTGDRQDRQDRGGKTGDGSLS